MSEDVSKPYTTITLESKKNYEEGWERIFGKKRKLKAQLHQINNQRHKIILLDRKSTRLNSSHITRSRMPSSA